MKPDVKGFTLTELMVTLAMTAIVMASVYGIFGVQAQRKKVEQKFIEMQQNARVALELMARDIRMAGFWGCMTPGNFKNTVRGQDEDVFLQMNPIYGLNNLASENAYGVKPNTDLLILSYADSDTGVPVDPPYMNNSSADIHLASAGSLQIGDIVLITDCSFTSVCQITNLNQSGRSLVHNTNRGGGNPDPANWTKDLGYVYGPGSFVYKVVAKYYWVSDQSELKASVGGFDPETNGYKIDLNVQTIAENVDDLQVQYGVDSDDDGRPDQWYSADAVPNWEDVIAAQLFLLVRSGKKDKDYTDTHTYSYADRAPQSYNDQYHRLLLQRVVTLRNRTM